MTIKMREKRATTLLENMLGPLTLGKLIRAIRQANHETQDIFSERLYMSKQQLSDIENDRKAVSVKSAAKYADILGYSREQFIKLCLQDTLLRFDLAYSVDVSPIDSARGKSLR